MGGMVVVPAPGSDLEGEMLLRAWREAARALHKATGDERETAIARLDAAEGAVRAWVWR